MFFQFSWKVNVQISILGWYHKSPTLIEDNGKIDIFKLTVEEGAGVSRSLSLKDYSFFKITSSHNSKYVNDFSIQQIKYPPPPTDLFSMLC